MHRHFYDGASCSDGKDLTTEALAAITARTLIVHGDRDKGMPVEIALEMYRSIPNSYLWVAANTGHPAFFGAGDEYMKITREFLRGWDAERS